LSEVETWELETKMISPLLKQGAELPDRSPNSSAPHVCSKNACSAKEWWSLDVQGSGDLAPPHQCEDQDK